MSAQKPPGASGLEILNEPDWTQTHSHRVGTRGRDARFFGLIHGADKKVHELAGIAENTLDELRQKVKIGELVTVRDIMQKQIVRSCLTHIDRTYREDSQV